jgi:hypothetical protein
MVREGRAGAVQDDTKVMYPGKHSGKGRPDRTKEE